MSDPFILDRLIPSGVNDHRARAFMAAASVEIEAVELESLLVGDAMTVDARLLPAMAIARTMTDFILPGMREIHIRRLLDQYRQIHALSGYIAGARRALQAIGIEIEWLSWFDQEPKGPHDTHIVKVLADGTIFDGDANPLSERAIDTVRRFIHLTQRWSQEVAIEVLLTSRTPMRVGAYARVGGVIRTRIKLPENQNERAPQPIAAVSAMGGVYHTTGLRAH